MTTPVDGRPIASTTPRAPSGPDRRPCVLVGVDGSPAAVQALEVARAEAELRDGRLEVVWAWRPADVPEVGAGHPQAWADHRVGAWAATVRSGPHQVTPRAVAGRPGPALVAAAHEADLVVVGARHRRGPLGAASVSRHLVEDLRAPLMVVREGVSGAPVRLGGPIVVGIDGSDASRRALVWALHEAALRSAEVVAVHGWDVTMVLSGPVPLALDDRHLLARAGQRLVDDELRRVRSVCPTVGRRGMAIGVRGASAPLDTDLGPSLVVVGRRSRRPPFPLALGSVSRRVVADAVGPVVVVH